jgi:hypothetical protein
MPAESFGTGEARGLRRKYLLVCLIVGAVGIVLGLAVGRPAISIAGSVVLVLGTTRGLSVRGRGTDPSKSTIGRIKDRDFRKYGRPF